MVGGVVDRINPNIDNNNYEQVKVCTLDEYIASNRLESQIGFIWLDAQGHEASIIHGGLKTIKNSRVPMWQEFNPDLYKRDGKWEQYLKDIISTYDFFVDSIDIRNGKLISRSISEIANYPEILKRNLRRDADIFLY